MAGRLWRAGLAAAAAAVAVAGCGAPARASSPVAAPGILAGSVTIGSYQPLTGPASAGAGEVAAASAAYFRYVNAHGGVYGRRIVYRYLDDRGEAALAPSIVHRLVQQDNVLAIFNPAGDAAHQSTLAYLNAARVPDLFAASGCPCWDDPAAFPQTFGWRLDYIREGKILGHYLAQRYPGRKTGVFYDDSEPGRDGAKGLGYEIPRRLLAAVPHDPASASAARQAAALKASGATVVVAFTTPAGAAALLVAMAHLNYRPHLALASQAADPAALRALLAATLGGNAAAALIQGVITDTALPPAASAASTWIKLFRRIHNQYLPHAPFGASAVDAMAAAYTFTQALLRAGPNPTRQSLLAAITTGLPQGPALAPLAYSAASHAGLTGAAIAVIRGGTLTLAGPVLATDGAPAGPVTPLTTPQPPAPPGGIPPH